MYDFPWWVFLLSWIWILLVQINQLKLFLSLKAKQSKMTVFMSNFDTINSHSVTHSHCVKCGFEDLICSATKAEHHTSVSAGEFVYNITYAYQWPVLYFLCIYIKYQWYFFLDIFLIQFQKQMLKESVKHNHTSFGGLVQGIVYWLCLFTHCKKKNNCKLISTLFMF